MTVNFVRNVKAGSYILYLLVTYVCIHMYEFKFVYIICIYLCLYFKNINYNKLIFSFQFYIYVRFFLADNFTVVIPNVIYICRSNLLLSVFRCVIVNMPTLILIVRNYYLLSMWALYKGIDLIHSHTSFDELCC